MYVFGAAPIELTAGKEVRSLTLHAPPDSGAGSLHVFAWSFA